jgi:hypothetical protein
METGKQIFTKSLAKFSLPFDSVEGVKTLVENSMRKCWWCMMPRIQKGSLFQIGANSRMAS